MVGEARFISPLPFLNLFFVILSAAKTISPSPGSIFEAFVARFRTISMPHNAQENFRTASEGLRSFPDSNFGLFVICLLWVAALCLPSLLENVENPRIIQALFCWEDWRGWWRSWRADAIIILIWRYKWVASITYSRSVACVRQCMRLA